MKFLMFFWYGRLSYSDGSDWWIAIMIFGIIIGLILLLAAYGAIYKSWMEYRCGYPFGIVPWFHRIWDKLCRKKKG